MTKSKLLKLLEKHDPNTVVIRYYDFKKMELEVEPYTKAN